MKSNQTFVWYAGLYHPVISQNKSTVTYGGFADGHTQTVFVSHCKGIGTIEELQALKKELQQKTKVLM